jgi:hypothetical protein
MLWPDFRRYADFSPETPNSTALLSLLNTGYLTRNGDYAPFAMISESLSGVFGVLNTIPGVSVPRKPEQLAARVAFLSTLMEITIRIYKCSSMSAVIGGKSTHAGHQAGRNVCDVASRCPYDAIASRTRVRLVRCHGDTLAHHKNALNVSV